MAKCNPDITDKIDLLAKLSKLNNRLKTTPNNLAKNVKTLIKMSKINANKCASRRIIQYQDDSIETTSEELSETSGEEWSEESSNESTSDSEDSFIDKDDDNESSVEELIQKRRKQGKLTEEPIPGTSKESTNKEKTWKDKCLQVINEIIRDPRSRSFRTLPDPLKYPRYYQKISIHLDLTSVKEQLLCDNYDTVYEFCEDMKTIFENSIEFYNKKTKISNQPKVC